MRSRRLGMQWVCLSSKAWDESVVANSGGGRPAAAISGAGLVATALDLAIPAPGEPVAELGQAIADRGVVDVVADLDDQAADQGGIDLQAPDRGGAAEQEAKRPAEGVLLGVVQGDGGSHRHRLPVLEAVPGRPGPSDDRCQQAEPAVAVQDA